MKYLFAYRNIAAPASVITLICCYQIWTSDSSLAVAMMIWVKLITSAGLLAYLHLFKSNVAFFFMNLGVGKSRFYLSIFIIDFIWFSLIATLIILVK
jgi:hypothetical protein